MKFFFSSRLRRRVSAAGVRRPSALRPSEAAPCAAHSTRAAMGKRTGARVDEAPGAAKLCVSHPSAMERVRNPFPPCGRRRRRLSLDRCIGGGMGIGEHGGPARAAVWPQQGRAMPRGSGRERESARAQARGERANQANGKKEEASLFFAARGGCCRRALLRCRAASRRRAAARTVCTRKEAGSVGGAEQGPHKQAEGK